MPVVGKVSLLPLLFFTTIVVAVVVNRKERGGYQSTYFNL